MNFHLKFTNKFNECFYFVATGATHYSPSLERTIHLIASTTPLKSKARVFESEEEANTVLARAGGPSGWEVVSC